jgi:hypothetical protein
MMFEIGIENNYSFDSMFVKQEDKYRGTIIIWSIFVLDRRWSFFTGLPAALKDNDIDHFRPVSHASSPKTRLHLLI